MNEVFLKRFYKLLKQCSHMIAARYCFVHLVFILLILDENSRINRPDPYPKDVIYAYIGLFLLLGFMTSGNFAKYEASLAAGISCIFGMFYACYQKQLGYENPHLIRFCVGHIGMAGTMFIYGYFQCKKQFRSHNILRIGQIFLGIHSIGLCFLFTQNAVDINAVLKFGLGGKIYHYILLLIFGLSALCLIPNFFSRDIIFFMLIAEIMVIYVFSQMRFWHNMIKVLYWNQIRLIFDFIFVCIGLVMYICQVKMQNYSKED